MLSGFEDGAIVEIPAGYRPVSTRQPHRYYDIARTDDLFFKQASEYYFEVVNMSSVFSTSGPSVDAIRRPNEEEYPYNIEELSRRFPELAQLSVDADNLHFLLLHRLQYERLTAQFGPSIPDAAFVLTRDTIGKLRPTIVQRAINGQTLLEIMRQPSKHRDEQQIGEELYRYTRSVHVDWAFENFIWSSNTLYYVDSKPTLFRTRRQNEENKRALTERFVGTHVRPFYSEESRQVRDMPRAIQQHEAIRTEGSSGGTDAQTADAVLVPSLGRSYDVPSTTLHPYHPQELSKALPRLRGKIFVLDFQPGVPELNAAVQMVREKLAGARFTLLRDAQQSDAVVRIQSDPAGARFLFVVADPQDPKRAIAGRCGPRELALTILSAIAEHHAVLSEGEPATGLAAALLARVTELTRAIYAAELAQDRNLARSRLDELRTVVEQFDGSSDSQVIAALYRVLGDAANIYDAARFPEARELLEATIKAYAKIGPAAVPSLQAGVNDSRPAIRDAFSRARRACEGRKRWRLWR
jgi:hypothetical protein